MWRPWKAETVQSVFTTESRQKSRRLFAQTHHPITRILISHNRLGLTNQSFIGETDLLEILHQSRPLDHNRVFLVVGETGSGKSELCQWLEYNLAETHRPIHIPRRQSSLDGILVALQQCAPEAPLAESKLPPQDVLEAHLHAHLRLMAHRNDHEVLEHYVQHIEDPLHHIVAELHEKSRLPEAPELAKPFVNCPEPALLGQWLQAGLREALGVRALEPLLQRLVNHLASDDVRPVLLLEDVTTLGFLRDDLLDFIFDLSAPGFDVVIGLTSGFESSHISSGTSLSEMAYVRDRIAARMVLSNTSGDTFFLSSPDDLTNLVRGYLACLPRKEAAEVFSGLYPFTPRTVERLFVHLVESGTPRQTPRNLLDAVIRPLLSEEHPPYLSLMNPHPYLRTPAVLFRHEGLSEAEIGLLYWYGIRKNGRFVVEKELSTAFGFKGYVSAEAFEMPLESSSLIRKVSTNEDEQHLHWEEAFRQLREWRRRGSETTFPKRHVLKKGVQRFINAVANPRLVQHPHSSSSEADPLKYHRGADTLPIYLPESGDVHPEGDWPVLTIAKNNPERLFEEFLNYAFGAAESIQCFADPAGTLETVSGITEAFQRDLRQVLRKLLGTSIENMALGSWILAQQLSGGSTGREAVALHSVLDYRSPTSDISAWDDSTQYKVLTRTSASIINLHEAYRRWFVSFFHTRDDFIDPDLLENHLRGFDLRTWLDTVGNIDLRRVRKAPFRLEASGLPLVEIVKPVVEYARGVENYGAFEEDKEHLKEALGTLQQYLDHYKTPSRILGRLAELTQELGWMEWSIPNPPSVDREGGRILATRVHEVLMTIGNDAQIDGTAVRFWLAKTRAFPIVAWDYALRDHIGRLNGLLDAHLPRITDLEGQRSKLTERAIHVVVALRAATT